MSAVIVHEIDGRFLLRGASYSISQFGSHVLRWDDLSSSMNQEDTGGKQKLPHMLMMQTTMQVGTFEMSDI